MKQADAPQPRKKSLIYRDLSDHYKELADYEEWEERHLSRLGQEAAYRLSDYSAQIVPEVLSESFPADDETLGFDEKSGFDEKPDTATPARRLKVLLMEPWFDRVCRDPQRYDPAWRRAWIDSLMASPDGQWIARGWTVPARRLKVSCMVVGLLCQSGVLVPNYSLVAQHMRIEGQDPATLAKYMGLKGKKCQTFLLSL